MMKLIYIALFALLSYAQADDNPGHLDSPAAIALIQAQIKDNGQDPLSFDIQYIDSQMTADTVVQRYSVINKVSGTALIVIVALHWEKDTSKTHL
jgi:hypothetical protein